METAVPADRKSERWQVGLGEATVGQVTRARTGVGAAGPVDRRSAGLPALSAESAGSAGERCAQFGPARRSERAAAAGSLGPGAAEAGGASSAIAASNDGSAPVPRKWGVRTAAAAAATTAVQLAELGTGSSSAAAAAAVAAAAGGAPEQCRGAGSGRSAAGGMPGSRWGCWGAGPGLAGSFGTAAGVVAVADPGVRGCSAGLPRPERDNFPPCSL